MCDSSSIAQISSFPTRCLPCGCNVHPQYPQTLHLLSFRCLLKKLKYQIMGLCTSHPLLFKVTLSYMQLLVFNCVLIYFSLFLIQIFWRLTLSHIKGYWKLVQCKNASFSSIMTVPNIKYYLEYLKSNSSYIYKLNYGVFFTLCLICNYLMFTTILTISILYWK